MIEIANSFYDNLVTIVERELWQMFLSVTVQYIKNGG